MGTKLSPQRQAFPVLEELRLLNRGKVRDTYKIDDTHLLIVASDSVSIFDFVLNATIPNKGIVLNQLSHFWFTMFHGFGIDTHMVAVGESVNRFLPANYRDNADLLARSMVVRKLEMDKAEFIGRGYLTGSGLKAYQEHGSVCGHQLMPGLLDGDKLPFVLDTPTTKAEVGHDEHLDADAIRKEFPEETYLLIKTFQMVWEYLFARGILLADTKLEFGRYPGFKEPIIGDEVFTPDSSRFWERVAWERLNAARSGKTPPPFDKQVIRNWGISIGINKRKPEIDEDVAWVHQQEVPDDLIRIAEQTYRYIFWRITGETIEGYSQKHLRIALPERNKKVVVLLGSKSDLPQLEPVISSLRSSVAKFPVHVISCHRNPNELLEFVDAGCGGANVIVAAGGKAFQLPGILDALIAGKGMNIPVIGVAMGDPATASGQAARLSISEIPGEPVLMDEIKSRVYAGPEGLRAAVERITFGELPPPKIREKKPVEFDIPLE